MISQSRLSLTSITKAALLASLTSIVACGGGGGRGGGRAPSDPNEDVIDPSDDVAPSVLLTSPANEDVSIAIDSVISIHFSESMNPDTLNTDTVQVFGEDDLAEGKVVYVDQPEPTATFAVNGELPDSTLITVHLTSDVSDLAGNRLEEPFSFTFTTIDLTGPKLQVDFPGGDIVTQASTLSLTGSTSDFSSVIRVEANGRAVQSDDGFQTWRTDLALLEGDNSVKLVATDDLGNVTEQTLNLRNDIVIDSTAFVGFDDRNDALIMSSDDSSFTPGQAALLAVDFESGLTRLLSQFGVRGAGPDLTAIGGLFVSGNSNRAWVSDPFVGAIYEIDLSTGDRSELSGPNVGVGPEMNRIGRLTFDGLGNRLFVTDLSGGIVFEVDRRTGNRSIFTSSLAAPSSIAFSFSLQQVFVIDATTHAIHGFDSNDSQRSGIISDSSSPGPELGFVIDMTYDRLRDRLYVSDADLQAVVQVELNGTRTILSQLGDGEGPLELVGGLDYGRSRDRIFMADIAMSSALIIGTNARSELTRTSVGAGPRLRNPRFLAQLSSEGAPAKMVAIKSVGSESSFLAVDSLNGTRQSGDEAFGSGDGPELGEIQAVSTATSTQILFVIDNSSGGARVMAIDALTGNRREVSSADVGNGENLEDAQILTVNEDGSTLWVHSPGKIVEVDSASGNRVLISSEQRGGGRVFDNLQSIVFDEINRRLLVGFGREILAVNLANGDRTILSEPLDGGPSLSEFIGLAIDSVSKRLIAVGRDFVEQDSLIAIDLSTGTRTAVSGATRGAGTQFSHASGLVVDSERGCAFVSDESLNTVFAIDLESGDRAIYSK